MISSDPQADPMQGTASLGRDGAEARTLDNAYDFDDE